MQAPANPFSIGNCLDYAWTNFKQNMSDYVLAQFVLVVPYFALTAAISFLGRRLGVLTILLPPILWTCSMSIALAGARNGKPKLEDAFRPLTERQGDYLMVCLAMAAGAIACFVGIVVTWWLFLFASLFALQGRDFQRAISESKDLVLKYPGDVAILAIVVWALNLAGGLACGIGIIFSMPIASLTVLRGYEQLTARLALESPAQPPAEPPPAQY
ncbi:MAG TPA: hypothetical protein VJR89_25450 [Polyangiales bacterium]|nr:hypothetical protein [Polyangiales bacterium]